MTDGCEQRERFPLALTDGYFRPDETSLETLVAMSADLGARLRFVDHQLQPSGTWGELFDEDEALVLARIAAADLDAEQAAFVRDADSAPLAALVERTVALASRIDHWLKLVAASDEPGARSVRARIEHLVHQTLGDDLAWVMERFLGDRSAEAGSSPSPLARKLATHQRRFDAIWSAPRPMRVVHAERSDREMLRSRFFSFISAGRQVQELARELLPHSLESQRHAPAAGLLMAFLQLHQVVQRRINQFTSRHADFYYDEVLRMRPLPAVADSVHLVVGRDPRANQDLVIARGTPFSAGKDAEGQPIVFKADDTLLVSDARVSALLTLRLYRDPLISPEREFGFATAAESARLPWPAADAGPVSADVAPPYWPLFGGGMTGGNTHAQEARLGLAFASPLLLLKEGEREVRLRLVLGHPAEADARAQTLAARFESRADEGAISARRLRPMLFKQYLLGVLPLLSPAERSDLNGLALRLAERAAQREEEHPTPAQHIDLDTGASVPTARASSHDAFLVELTASAPTQELFFARLGKLFTVWLMSHDDWLDEAMLAGLRDTASRLLDETERTPPTAGDPRCLLQGPNRPERALIFGQVFNSLFEFALSTEAGWLAVSDFYVASGDPPPRPGELRQLAGRFAPVDVVLRLRPHDPAIVGCDPAVHGSALDTTLPVLQLRLRSDGRLYPYSLLEELLLHEATLSVNVRGARELLLDNQLGRLDASKPFMPFGPLPSTSSYLVFGSPEMARKNVARLAINLRWAGLPDGQGGFERFYADYSTHEQGPDATVRNGSFTATASILRDGVWQPAGAPGSVALFHTADAAGRLQPTARLTLDEAALRTHAWGNPERLEFRPGVRSGFYRLQLAGPSMAFGHALYPTLLTETVTANTLRRRRKPLPMPPAPYTPLIEDITLDYSAQSTLVFGRDSAPAGDTLAADTERVLHLHPFGVERIHPGAAGASPTLLPRVGPDGSLYIGLSVPEGQELGGHLTLHFHLRDEAAAEPLNGDARVRTQWACLVSNQWRPLAPAEVVSDTTCGFLTSGIVTLNIPRQIDRNNTVLPSDRYWLRLSASGGFEHFAALYGVRAQALRASRVLSPAQVKSGLLSPLPAGTVKEPTVTIYGLSSVAQIGPSFGMRAAEDRQQMRTRVGERLQHKQRASTPWDYERLVLEQFPSVLKVKCFAHLSSHVEGVSPGDVLVVVVPVPPTVSSRDEAGLTGTAALPGADAADAALSASAEPHLNAVELARIQAYLKKLASPFARIHVRNAVYERIQVRCTVKLAPNVQAGRALRQVNQAITDYLSPWREGGCKPSFDWTIRCEDVEAHIRALDCVDFVTQLSLLHVARSDGRVFTLGDTARGQAVLTSRAHARSPWSIALPMREHMVRTVEGISATGDDRPQASGIAHLSIGSTFIVGEATT
jgi:hypothetical protein